MGRLSGFINNFKFKKMVYLVNAFSLQMLDLTVLSNISVEPISIDTARELTTTQELFNESHEEAYQNGRLTTSSWTKINCVMAIGHADTTEVVTECLTYGDDVRQAARVNVSLKKGDILVVAQLVGGRLPEGTKTLPEGFSIVYVKVTIQ